jgi:hypothetical protein
MSWERSLSAARKTSTRKKREEAARNSRWWEAAGPGKGQILSLGKEKRGEEVRAWDHVSSLMKAKRQLLMEYQNLLNTKEALEGSTP